MFVTGRKWWKFLSYSRQFPPLLVHVERDEAIQTAIRSALDRFLSEFDRQLAIVNEIRNTPSEPRTPANP
jgi:hypothetical protein